MVNKKGGLIYMTVSELIQELQKITNQNKIVSVPEDEFYGKLKPVHKISEYHDKVVIE